MTDLPVWLQGIRDRANKATPEPWYVMEDDDDLCMCMVGVAKDPMNSYGDHGNTIAITLLQAPRVADVDDARWDENADFIAHSRADVPRLVELVGEMAEVLESFRDTDCQRMGCMQCRDDVCLSKLWGRLDDVLAKYHGEVESND